MGQICLIAIVLLASLMPLTALAVDPKHEQLRVGYIEKVFTGVNLRDAEAAFKSFARAVGVMRGYNVAVTVDAFPNVAALRAVPPEQRPDLMIYDSLSFVAAEDMDWHEPVFVSASEQGDPMQHFLLLGRAGRGAGSGAALRGGHLNLVVAANALHGEHWLSRWLEEQGLGAADQFFGKVERIADPMTAVLRVFFGKADAVVVDSQSYALMVELNPQLARLDLVSSSEPMANSVISLVRQGSLNGQFRSDLLDAMHDLHNEAAGQQVLALFKTARLAGYRSEHLETIRDLHRRMLPTRGGS